MRIGHIADTHLGYRQYNLEERENDIYDAFNEVIDRMIEERVDVVIHAGDFFDSPHPPIKALYVAKEGIKKLREHNIPILTVLGEHDTPRRRAMPPHLLLDIPILGIGQVQKVVINDVAFFGISNLKGHRVELLKEELSKVDLLTREYNKSVLIAHQAIKKFLPFEEAYELEMADLPREITYYAFGHIHSRVIEQFGKGYLAYSGSTEIMRKSEISSWKRHGKGIYIVDLEGDLPEIHQINLESIRPQFELSYTQNDNISKELRAFIYMLFEENIPPKKAPILKLNVQGDSIRKPEIIERVRGILEDLVPHKILRYDVHFSGADVLSSLTPEELKEIGDLKTLFTEYLGDAKLGELAFELYSHLWKDDIEGGIEVCMRHLEGEEE
ncbi:MAG: repair protein SbcD/Mre11 [Thermococcaceae archaeon]|uniref:metallophosphoesterase family protein n=1 Tax=Pyrococcus sp. TaxID=33866 RepID=UPI002588E5E3|nr:DNA repair exonuclease [Pyrococcus sp.]MDK2783492.1 repair protein SbcD/Mre11 [Thermococcaceae archaeon]MDK2870355.1 repair protein SbcD/Mre11 [Pyrococcus sp.]MDK2983707.1 repair protein SbcD/Mre11 [Thermococcaceae archaeon]